MAGGRQEPARRWEPTAIPGGTDPLAGPIPSVPAAAAPGALQGQYEIVGGLLRRLHLSALSDRNHPVLILGLFSLLNGCLSIGLMAGAAFALQSPLVFPSLGATAFLLFTSPHAPAASPRNTVLGHVVGVAMGWLSLAAFGLLDAGPAVVDMITVPRAGAAALSLGLTACLLTWLRSPHPPGGATTLIVSLGLFTTPAELLALLLAVLALVAQGVVINRLAGIDYPLWSPRPATSRP
jgi:CBS domain-containing membrane protein